MDASIIEEWDNEFRDISKQFAFDKINKIIKDTHWVIEILGDNAQRQPQIGIINKNVLYLDVEFLLATDNTLKSILSCCKLGSFSDAYVLIRKFRDDLFQYLFIVNAINKIETLKNERYAGLEEVMIECLSNFDSKKLLEIFDNINQSEKARKKSNLENGIGAWFNSTLEKNSKLRGEFFDTVKYKESLCENTLIKECFELYLNSVWNQNNRKLNNFTHGNGREYILGNAYCLKKDYIDKWLDEIGTCIWQITSCFLSVLILIKPSYIMSSDLSDFLDFGLTAPDDVQYSVAPVFQNYIDTYIVKINEQLKDYLKSNNPYGMKIE